MKRQHIAGNKQFNIELLTFIFKRTFMWPWTSTFCMPVYFFHPLLAVFLDFSRSAFNLLVNGFLDWHRNSWKQRGKPFKLSEEGTKHLPYGHNATPTCLHIQVLQNTSKKYPDGQKYSLLVKKKCCYITVLLKSHDYESLLVFTSNTFP